MNPISIALISFFATMLAALIGALISPSFAQFLNNHRVKRDERLKYLEEAYVLSQKIQGYSKQFLVHLIFLLGIQQYKREQSELPKIPDEPFSRMGTVLDYYLNAPVAFFSKTKELHNALQCSIRPIAKAINEPNNIKTLHTDAITQCLDAAEKISIHSEEIAKWVKQEKSLIENTVSIYQAKFWVNVYVSFKTKFSNSTRLVSVFLRNLTKKYL